MSSLLAAFHTNVEQFADAPCWRFKQDGQWRAMSWREVGALVQRFASWWIERGLQPGDCVALWSATRWEWSLTDLAVLAAGGVVVPVYQNLPADQAAVIINEPRTRFLVVDHTRGDNFFASLAHTMPTLEGIVLFDGTDPASRMPLWSLAEILSSPLTQPSHERERDYTARWRARDDAALASLVYTSGTTGRPKGVMLSLANFQAEVAGLSHALKFPPGTECLECLPLAHIVARAMQFYQILLGLVGCYAESIEQLGNNLREVRPHFFVGVPRIFEKMQSRIVNGLAELPPRKQRLVQWAMRVTTQCAEYTRQGGAVPWRRRLPAWIAGRILAPLQRRLGGRLRLAISGGAPLSKNTALFFQSLGLLILEGYGLTETCAAVAVNHPDDYRFGTVGRIVDGVQLRLADDGEILVQGRVVSAGYYQRAQETRDAIDPQGWFHTGDIGEFTRDGFVRITDRKKDLIKTSGGKYIAPQPIENALKSAPLISDVILFGDGRQYLTALIVLDPAACEVFAKTHGIAFTQWNTLTTHPQIVVQIAQAVEQVNAQLASFETIKHFRILDRELAIDQGELTPTLKIRRSIAVKRYQALFDQMYEDGASTRGAGTA